MSTINKPLILENDGIWGQLANGAFINAGGTTHGTFTVGGRGLLFDDGQSTSTGTGAITLQSVYDNTPDVGGAASIKLTTGKDLTVIDDTNNSIYFKIDSETGKVTITGDLEVLGGSSVINSVIQDSDHWLISPRAGNTISLKIEPDFGVIPIVDIVSIRKTFGTAPVFRIDADGNATIGSSLLPQNLTVNGLINNINLQDVKNDIDFHLASVPAYKHTASNINITTIAAIPAATNVQEALEQINTRITNGGATSGARGYEHNQPAVATVWTITHNLASLRAQTTVYDTDWEVVIPNSIKVIDNNTIRVSFNTGLAGKAMIFAF